MGDRELRDTRGMMRLVLPLAAALALAGCTAREAPNPDVDEATLRTIGDRFDAAQINQDGPALERLVADQLVFVGSSGKREGKKEFIAGFTDPDTRFEPIKIADRYFTPLGPDTGVVGGDVVLRGTSGGQPFAARIRFADTFRRLNGEWRAVHIQATSVAEPRR